MDLIPQPLLLAISMAACLGGSLIRKIYSDKFPGSALARNVYNAVSTGVSAVALAVMAICFYGLASLSSVSLFTLLLAVAFGVITALQQLMMLKAFEVGPFAYTSVITSLSMLIPTLSGALIFKTETIRPLQYVGIALMVVCLVLSVDTKKGAEEKKASLKWMLFCGGSFIFCGLIGVMQTWHQSNAEHRDELNAFLVIAFVIAFVYSTAMSLISLKKEPKRADGEGRRFPFLALLPLLLIAMAGVCGAANNMFNLYLVGKMEKAVFFPLVNGGGLILTTLSAVIIFREKLSVKQWIGMAFGVAAVFLLCF